MTVPAFIGLPTERVDSGLRALCGVAAFFRIVADPASLARELALQDRMSSELDIVRGAQRIGLKARVLSRVNAKRLSTVPVPALICMSDGSFKVMGERCPSGRHRLVDPMTGLDEEFPIEDIVKQCGGKVILLARATGRPKGEDRLFGLSWFLPSIWRYRRPLLHVLFASLFVQIFALVTPLFFQVIVDKVLVQKTYGTLLVLIAGLAVLGLFEVILQYLRTYALSHTSNRIDVELGQRLFRHLLRLPLGYFETRSAGQTVARLRELETIRSFLTGQALFSAIDLLFTVIFMAVLFAYSWKLTIVVLVSIPIYVLIGALLMPSLREGIKEKFNRSAVSQQFLVETVVGIGTVKSSAVEPAMQVQWEEKLVAYVKTAFTVTLQAALGQNAIQYISKISTAAILLLGAKAVIDGEMTIGALVAFNMIAGQVVQPILRLSQLWQDFQQVKTSVDRLGDVLNEAPEPSAKVPVVLSNPAGKIEFRNVRFRFNPNGGDILNNVCLTINAGEVIGIVGPSGSGKSTLSKLVQRLYLPQEGAVLLDGIDLARVDPAWLRSKIGVVLQDSMLFNRTVHENIAFANPGLPRMQVIHLAKLAGADEFIAKLPHGYDTVIEERGANLSGGQRQRISIARALSTNPRILIFDEATSALDYESERVIQQNMRSITSNRTVIIIAHRLAAVRQCHRIVSINDGRVMEAGSHDELLAQHEGLYAHLWRLQNEQMGVMA